MIIVGTQAGRASPSVLHERRGLRGRRRRTGESEFMIGDGDVFQAWTDARRAPICRAARSSTTHPVAVFSGNIATTYGKTAAGIHSPDMAHEQCRRSTPGAQVRGGRAAAPGGDLRSAARAARRVDLAVAGGKPTDTRVDFTVRTARRPCTAPSRWRRRGARGDCDRRLRRDGVRRVADDARDRLRAQPVAGRLGGPAARGPTFAVLPSFDQMVAVVRMHSDRRLELSRRAGLARREPIDETLFLPAGGGYEVAHVPLAAVPRERRVCTHRLQGHFGMSLRGMDVLASYALTAPAWGGCRTSVACALYVYSVAARGAAPSGTRAARRRRSRRGVRRSK